MTFEYPMTVNPSRVFTDITRYFNDGMKQVPNIRYRLTDTDPFYSNSMMALEAISQPKATPEQWKAMLLKNGAKEAEMEWMGWDEFVQGKKSFTKDEVRSWMEANKVDVKEVELATTPESDAKLRKLEEEHDDAVEALRVIKEGFRVDGNFFVSGNPLRLMYRDSSGKNHDVPEKYIDTIYSYQGAIDAYNEYINADPYFGGRPEGAVKYSDYQTPGGEDYRELLIMMPVEHRELPKGYSVKKIGESYFVYDDNGEIVSSSSGRADVEIKALNEINRKTPHFRGGHFDATNIVVHVRFNSRTDADGNRVLFIEEIQSDWAQKGKKEGFGISTATKEQVANELYGKPYDELSAELKNSVDVELEARRTPNMGVVPDMPFKQTPQWVGLALKRMVRYAADNGFDRIAWTTGEMQAERYDLSKQVDEVKLIPQSNLAIAEQTSKKQWELSAYKGDGNLFRTAVNDDEIEQYIGKEAAKRLIESTPDKYGIKTLSGLDLKVGGEGMKAFYDNIVPNTANKLFKRYGAQVEESNFKTKSDDKLDESIRNQVQTVKTLGADIARLVNQFNKLEGVHVSIANDRIQYDFVKAHYNYDGSFDRNLNAIEVENIKKSMLDGRARILADEIEAANRLFKSGEEKLRELNDEKKKRIGTVQSLPITPQLQEAALGGFPMFRIVKNPRYGEYKYAGELLDKYSTQMQDFMDSLKEVAAETGREFGADIRVVNRKSALPQDVQRRMRIKPEDKVRVPAIYDPRTGITWLLADGLPNTLEAYRSVLHEVVAHHGMRRLFGERYNDLLRDIWKSMPTADRNRLASLYKSNDILLLADEYLANKAENLGQAPGFIKRAIAQIRTWLRKMFGIKFSNNDIKVLLNQSRDNLRKRASMAARESGFAGDVLKHMTLYNGTPQEAEDNTEGFSEETDDIRYQLTDPTFTEPTPEEAIIGKPMLVTTEEKFREFIQDKMLSVRRLQEKIEKEGGHVDDLSDIYNDENRSSSRSKKQMEEWENKSWTPLIELISRISRDYNMSLDDIQTYMKAKHAPERNKYYNEKYKTTDQVYAGKIRGYESSDAVSGFYVDAFENAVPEHVVEEMWEKVRQATGYALDRYLNDGFISRDMYDDIKARYEYYIPLRGWKAETADEIFDYQDTDIQSGFNPFKKAFGRESEADDPLPYIWAMANTAIVSGNKNLVKQKALNLYRQNKDRSDLFKIQKLYIITDPTTGNSTEQVEKPDQDLFDAGVVSTKYNPIHHPRITRYMAKQHELVILEGGQRHLMTFTDPNVAVAINGENVWSPDFSRHIQESIGRVTRYLSMMLTSKNPAFMPVNWIRDVGMASMWHFIRNEGDTGKFIKNLPIAAQAIRRYFNGKAQETPNQMDQKYMAWLLGGGATGYVHLKDMDQLRRKMEREFRVLTDTRKKMDYVTTNKMVTAAGYWLNYMAEMSENMSRFATYLTSLEMGRTHEQALSDSKNVTVNFNRKGRISGLLNSLFAFFNAGVQGSHTLLKLGRDYPVRTAQVAIGFMALGYLTASMTRFLSPPDEDGVKYYDKLSPFLRQNFMVLPNPLWIMGKQQDKFVTIPLPWGFSSLYSMGVIAHDWQTEQTTVTEGMFDIADNIYSAFSPINLGAGMLTGDKIGTWKMARPIVPTAVMPLYDVAMNEDFAGYQIFREPFTKELEKITPQSELGMPYTNRYLTIATRNLNKFMGGDEYRKARWRIDPETGELKDQGWRNLFDINPSKLEHILEGYTGGVGTELNNVVKTITSAVEKAQGVPGAEVYSRNIPVLRRLYRQASKGNTSREYYEYKEMIGTYTYLINKYRNVGMEEPYGKMIQYDQIKGSQKVMEATEKRISSLKEKAKRLPDDSEALTELYDQMDEIREQAVIKIKELNFKER